MKLTVMMAAYNTAPFVGDAIDSLLCQRGELDIEVLVVNDGSTDDTGAILRGYRDRGESVRLVETPNQGVVRARNEALAALGECDLVSFLDSDDLSPQGHFAAILGMFRNDPGLDLVYCSACLFERTGDDRFAPQPGSRTATVRGVHLGSGVYRKSLIDRVGLFDTSFQQAEDIDYMMRMFELSPRYLISDSVGLYYRRHGNNMTRDKAVLRRDFSRALMGAVRRRRAGNLPALPPGLFDGTNMIGTADW
jgi:glycosyltransferase involved in cell wall biosynthesis